MKITNNSKEPVYVNNEKNDSGCEISFEVTGTQTTRPSELLQELVTTHKRIMLDHLEGIKTCDRCGKRGEDHKWIHLKDDYENTTWLCDDCMKVWQKIKPEYERLLDKLEKIEETFMGV